MTDTALPKQQIMKSNCAKCGGIRNCDVVGNHRKTEYSDPVTFWSNWYILECRGCNNVFFLRSNANSEDIDYDHDERGESFATPNEELSYWPALSKREIPDWINFLMDSFKEDNKLYPALLELYGALNNDLHMLAAIGIRTCFDIATESLGVDTELSFARKLDALVSQGKINSIEKERLKPLVDAGSATAHRGWIPQLDELNTMVDLLEHFLNDAFVSPAAKAKLDKKATALKAKVPPRKSKSKSTPKIIPAK